MDISNKKRKYIKRFGDSKTAEQLSAETGLPVSAVKKVMAEFGYTPVASQESVLKANGSNGQITIPFDSVFLVLVGIGLFVTPLFFLPGLYDMYSLSKFALLIVLAPLAGLMFVLHGLSAKKFSFFKCLPFPGLPFILFYALLVVSAFWAVNPFKSFFYMEFWFCALVFFFGTFHMLSRHEQIKQLSAVMALAATCVSIIGIFQFFKINPEFLYQAAVPGSTFGNKNYATQFIMGAFPFTLYAAYCYRKQFLGKLFSFCFFVVVYFIIITRTRSAWVGSTGGILIGCALLGLYIKRTGLVRFSELKKWVFYVIPGILFIAFFMVITEAPKEETELAHPDLDISDELTSIVNVEKGSSAHWRLTAWSNTLLMIKDRPFFGVGIGNWEYYYPLYARKATIDKDFNEDTQANRTHNDYLQVAAGIGIPGLILFLWMFGNVLFLSIKTAVKDSEPEWALLATTVTCGVIALMTDAVFNFPFQEALPPFVFAVISAFSVYGYLRQSAKKDVSVSSAGYVLFGFFAVLFLFNIWYANRRCMADYYFLIGKRYNKGEMFEKSLPPLRKSLKLYPYAYRTYSLLGRSLNELRQYPESVEVNRKALKLHPNYINCMNNLGNALRGIHHVDEAIEVYDRSLTLYPDFAEAHNNLGIAYKEKGDIESAKKEYEKAIEIDPKYDKAYNNLGNIYLSENKIDKAVDYYLRATKINPKLSDVYNNIGLAMNSKGDYAKAIGYFDECIKLNSRLPDPYNNKGTALKNQGKIAEAIEYFNKALAINAEYLPARNNLAETYVQQKKPESAIEEYEKMLQLDPSLKAFYQKTAELYLELYAEKKDIDLAEKAMAILEKGIGYYPTYPNFYTVLGKVYLELGQEEKAIAQFNKVLELTPQRPEAYFNLGVAYHQFKKYREALQAYQQALQLNPDFLFLHFEIGKICEQLGMYPEALASYKTFLAKWKGDVQYKERAQAKIKQLESMASPKK